MTAILGASLEAGVLHTWTILEKSANTQWQRAHSLIIGGFYSFHGPIQNYMQKTYYLHGPLVVDFFGSEAVKPSYTPGANHLVTCHGGGVDRQDPWSPGSCCGSIRIHRSTRVLRTSWGIIYGFTVEHLVISPRLHHQ